MFTGIVEEVGRVVSLDQVDDGMRLVIAGPLVTSDAQLGDSISVSGVCLTVTSVESGRFSADVMAQTIKLSALSQLTAGSPVNLERAATMSSRLGGHIVQGHVDGVGEVISRLPGEQWEVVRISLPKELAHLVAARGSIAVDGISLTVSDVGDDWFEVSLIPTTLAQTTLGTTPVGGKVNLETDVLARQIERMMQVRNG